MIQSLDSLIMNGSTVVNPGDRAFYTDENSMDFYTNVYRYGNQILVKGIFNGIRSQKKVRYGPSFFLPAVSESEWSSVYDKPLDRIKFESIGEARDFLDQYKGVEGMEIHGSNDYVCQYIGDSYPGRIDYDIDKIRVGVCDIEVWSGYIDEETGGVMPGPFPDADKALYPITAITVYDFFEQHYRVFALCDYEHNPDNPEVGHLNVEFTKHETEYDLLVAFLQYLKSANFDVFSGWNSENFDVPYIVNRLGQVMQSEWWQEYLSPWGIIKDRTVNSNYGDYTTYDWIGTSMIDYLELYRSFGTYSEHASYRLDAIANEVLGIGKLEYEGDLFTLYKKDPQRYIEYNIRDVDLIVRMDKKMSLFALLFTVNYMAKCNYNDVLGTVKMWDFYIYNYLQEKHVIVPPKVKRTSRDRYPGGYVMEPNPGKYGWGFTIDLASLYPHVIQQYNLGVETFIPSYKLPPAIQELQEKVKAIRDPNPESKPMGGRIDAFVDAKIDTSILRGTDITMAPNGECFRTDKMSVISEICRDIYDKRKAVKREMLGHEQEKVYAKEKDDKDEIERLDRLISTKNAIQLALKIMINSLYGATGNLHFRYFMVEIASAITCGGQVANRWAQRYVRDYLHELVQQDCIIYGDTDSAFVLIQPLLEKLNAMALPKEKLINLIDKISEEKVEAVIRRSYDDLAKYLNVYEQRMFMKREKIFESLVLVKKKRYTVAVWDNEGVRYKEPKIAVTGLESVRSTTAAFVSKKLKDAYKIALLGTESEMQGFVSKFKSEFMGMTTQEIALPTGVSEIDKWSDGYGGIIKGCPIHVRASLVHNQMVENKGLNIKPITNGAKIRFLHLRKPNPAKSHVVAFVDDLPSEFGVDKYVDKELMFEKAFAGPLQNTLDVVGWSAMKKATLNSFFG